MNDNQFPPRKRIEIWRCKTKQKPFRASGGESYEGNMGNTPPSNREDVANDDSAVEADVQHFHSNEYEH